MQRSRNEWRVRWDWNASPALACKSGNHLKTWGGQSIEMRVRRSLPAFRISRLDLEFSSSSRTTARSPDLRCWSPLHATHHQGHAVKQSRAMAAPPPHHVASCLQRQLLVSSIRHRPTAVWTAYRFVLPPSHARPNLFYFWKSSMWISSR